MYRKKKKKKKKGGGEKINWLGPPITGSNIFPLTSRLCIHLNYGQKCWTVHKLLVFFNDLKCWWDLLNVAGTIHPNQERHLKIGTIWQSILKLWKDGDFTKIGSGRGEAFRLSLTLSVPVRDRIQDYFIISSEKLKRGWTFTTSQYTVIDTVYFKTQRTVIENTNVTY